ncbi:MAG: hypothetical protein ABJA82_17505 [Myxococcales bacterium]
MNSPRGLMFWGLSLAVTLAAPGQRRISAAETAKAVAPATATTPTAKAKASPAAQPAAPAAPTKPVVQEPPRPADPSVVHPTPLTPVAAPAPVTRPPDAGAARDKGAAAADIMPLAGAGDGTANPAAAAAAAAAAAEGMPREPSIYETGRVGKMGVTDSGSKIKHSQVGAGGNREELPVKDRPSSPTRAGASDPTGHVDPAVLARELRPRFRLLKDCRVQVARQKHLAAKDVPVGSLTLRWTILRTGRVGDTEVVALSPVDGRVIDCMKRQMSLWSFTPPAGGPAAVERAFKFE